MSADRCSECGNTRSAKWGVIFHDYLCSHKPKPGQHFRRPERMSPPPAPYPEREQDRDARALRTLGAPVSSGCVFHPEWNGDPLSCPACIAVGDRDDFLRAVDWL